MRFQIRNVLDLQFAFVYPTVLDAAEVDLREDRGQEATVREWQWISAACSYVCGMEGKIGSVDRPDELYCLDTVDLFVTYFEFRHVLRRMQRVDDSWVEA